MSISFLFLETATVDFELVVNIKFDNALNNKNSSQYEELSKNAKIEVSLKFIVLSFSGLSTFMRYLII